MILPENRRRIAEEILGHPICDRGYSTCPGEHLHSHKTGKRDFRVILDPSMGPPTFHCFHGSCSEIVAEYNKKLRQAIGRDEWDGKQAPITPRAKQKPQRKKPTYNLAMLRDHARNCPVPFSHEALIRHSPVEISHMTPAETTAAFLQATYTAGQRILIFTRFYSQGDYLHQSPDKTCRLSDTPGVVATMSDLPTTAAEGIWYLVQPVTGSWKKNHNNPDENGNPKPGRRHAACCVSFPYLVIESDEAPEDLWLQSLVMLPFPIVAIYTSGGISIHALIKIGAKTKEEFDTVRKHIITLLTPLGADPAAITAVRLSRLPGTYRQGKTDKHGTYIPYSEPHLQRLLWLDPTADSTPIFQKIKNKLKSIK